MSELPIGRNAKGDLVYKGDADVVEVSTVFCDVCGKEEEAWRASIIRNHHIGMPAELDYTFVLCHKHSLKLSIWACNRSDMADGSIDEPFDIDDEEWENTYERVTIDQVDE